MIRVSPFTYFTGGIYAASVENTNVVCAANEYLHFNPPPGETCGVFMAPFIARNGGYLQSQSATDQCGFCTLSKTNAYMATFNIHPDQM
jgi:ATP-binding cassette subfamily G (WHITE) protein 2 (PDR)